MANMQATKTPMPEQDPNVRNKNFKEVTLGYTRPSAAYSAKNRTVLRAARLIFISRSLSMKLLRATLKRLMRSSPIPMRCPPFPAVSVRRRRSANPSASAATRASRWQSAV